MVEWSLLAKADLRLIRDFIAKDSTYYAEKVADDVVGKSEILNEFPEIGRQVPEIGDPNIRELFVHSYRLIYEVTSHHVVILAVIHNKRDFSSGDFDKLRSN